MSTDKDKEGLSPSLLPHSRSAELNGSADRSPTQPQKEPSEKTAKYLIVLSALAIAGIAALAVVFRDELKDFQQYGYLGAFVISVMSGGTIIVPVPGLPIIFALGGVLPYPFLVGIAAGLGEGLGSFNFYFAGRAGRGLLSAKHKSNRFYSKVETWMAKRGSLTLFLASAIPNPPFALIAATAGAMHLPAWKFYMACAAGKIVKGTYVAYLGAWGMHWFGISAPS